MDYIARTPNDIGHALRNARKARELSQQALAARSGIWQETISKIENGSPGTRLETICDLLAALDLELNVTERSKGEDEMFDGTT